jgi:uncharacterized protein (DUF2384 family)
MKVSGQGGFTLVLETSPARAIEQISAELVLTDRDLARILDADARTLSRWRRGSHYPQTETRRRLAALLALERRLAEGFTTPEARRDWLHAPSRYLGGLAPVEVLRAGRIDRVEDALEALDSGIFL